MPKFDKQEMKTAFHEAGHAVLAFLLDRKIRMVTIIPNYKSGYSGAIKLYRLRSFQPDCYADTRHRMIAEEEIMIRLAGGIAQALHQRKRWSWKLSGISQDVDAIFCHALCFEEGKALNAWMRYLVIRVTEMLTFERNWRYVQELASQLLKKKKMTGPEVRQFILQTAEAEFQAHLRKEGRAPCPPIALVGGHGKPRPEEER